MIKCSLAEAKRRIKAYMRENNCGMSLDKIREKVHRHGTDEELYNILEDMVAVDPRISKTCNYYGEFVYFYTYKKKRKYVYD